TWSTSWGAQNDIVAMGVHWQSLIVSPARLGWMNPPAVPGEAKFKWWNRLREVECAWVSNRGEADRFAYYDGPTTLRTPFNVLFDKDGVRFIPYALTAEPPAEGFGLPQPGDSPPPQAKEDV